MKPMGEARVLSLNPVQGFPVCVEAFDVALRFVITYGPEQSHDRPRADDIDLAKSRFILTVTPTGLE